MRKIADRLLKSDLKMKKLPPKCSSCEEPLFEVFENEYNTYVFDPASGTYKEHDWKGDMDIRCSNCNAKLWDIFPEGVCNYVSKYKQKLKVKMNE